MRELRRRCLHIVAAMLCSASSIAAQTLAGTVVLRGDSSPIVGAVVLVLDSTGTARARTLTDDRGHFSFRMMQSGAYRIRAMRIGLRALTTGPLMIYGDTSLVLTMTDAPPNLPAMTTREQSQCNLRPDSALALGALWEDAKTALFAAAITRERSTYRFDLLDHVRTFDLGTGELRAMSMRQSRTYDTRTWASLPPEQLRRDGYVIEREDTTFFVAPDIETLLSPYFVDTHCFRIVESPQRDSLVAIEFFPARNFKHAEVRGRLWVDRRSHELRTLDFHYVNLDAADSLAGGSVDFARLSTGAWVMTDWSIRLPMLRMTTDQYLTGMFVSRRRVVRGHSPMLISKQEAVAEELRVTGGTLRAVWHDSTLIWAPPPRALDVRVTIGSDRVKPRPNETVVYLVGTGRYAVADSDGRARFDSLVHGAYLVEVGTRQLDVLGWRRAAIEVDVGKSATELTEVNIAAPINAARVVCGDDANLVGENTGVLIGAVTRGNEPVAHRDVAVSWATDALPGSPARIESRTFRTLSGDGRFLACGVPRDRPINIRVDNTTATTRLARNEVVGIFDVALKP